MKLSGRKKILLFGGSGMLGKELSHSFSGGLYEIIAPSHKEADLSNQKSVFNIIRKIKPDIILNAAVLVNVDLCEENPGLAYAINALGPLFISDAIRELGLKSIFVQFSSSDIFGGKFNESPSEKEEKMFPVNVYSRSKYYGEKFLRGAENTYIVRSSWIYSEFKKTFVDAVAEHVRKPNGVFAAASDQRGIPTWGKEIAENTRFLIEKKYPYGIYHFVPDASKTDATRFEIAQEVAKILDRKDAKNLFRKALRAKVLKAPRPASSVIITTKFPKLSHWKESLRAFLKEKCLTY